MPAQLSTLNNVHTLPTISAIATPQGRGGVGVIRLSGSKSLNIALTLTNKTTFKPRVATFCRFYGADGTILDEGLVLYFKAPHSFTGEDVIELQGHGGVVLQNQLLSRTYELGAKPAEAGEFSYRAFENDKLDLVQLEAISDAIDATSIASATSAMRSLTGEFSKKIHAVLERLIELRLYVEASIDFSDEEDVDFLGDGVIADRLQTLIENVGQTLATAQQGQLLRDGVNVVLAGKPNAGKSSLLNRLAGVERAIVTEVAGTTRDTLQETLVLDGLTVYLTDTAGLRQTDDVVERIGIERTRQAIAQADVLMVLYDLSETDDVEALLDEVLSDDWMSLIAQNKLMLIGNKKDLITKQIDGKLPDTETIKIANLGDYSSKNTVLQVNVSCETGEGIESLISELRAKVGFHPPENSLIARTRHIDALRRTLTHLQDASVQLLEFQAGELVAESLRLAQQDLGEITGEFTSDALLGRIFSSFCIGK